MSFGNAVNNTPDLRGAWYGGLQALSSTDRGRLIVQDTRSIAGSVNIDVALRIKFPNESRWDYAIGYQRTGERAEIVYWVEVHPANTGSVNEVLAKLDWLRKWMSGNAPSLDSMKRQFVWISSGKTSFTSGSPQQKQLALQGVRHVGRVLRIADGVIA